MFHDVGEIVRDSHFGLTVKLSTMYNVELNSGSRLWEFCQQVAFRLTSLKRGRSAT